MAKGSGADEDHEALARAATRVGTVLRGKYQLGRLLGVGGMAAVYAATHRNGRPVAIKMLHPELSTRSDIRGRFVREGHAANAVKHAGAVAVLDDDVAEDGAAFLVMELLEGASLEQLAESAGGKLPPRAVTAIGIQLLDVLAAAHTSGIVHRDIKPANVFVTRDGHVKVLDFGIARFRDVAATRATHTGMMLGTPAFMAPEQALGDVQAVDAQTDVWAVGATLFALAAGRTVHDAETVQQIFVLAATRPAPALGSVAPWVPAPLAGVVDTALAFDKPHRWPSAGAMRNALRAVGRSLWGEEPGPEALCVRPTPDEVTASMRVDLGAEDAMVHVAKTCAEPEPATEVLHRVPNPVAMTSLSSSVLMDLEEETRTHDPRGVVPPRPIGSRTSDPVSKVVKGLWPSAPGRSRWVLMAAAALAVAFGVGFAAVAVVSRPAPSATPGAASRSLPEGTASSAAALVAAPSAAPPSTTTPGDAAASATIPLVNVDDLPLAPRGDGRSDGAVRSPAAPTSSPSSAPARPGCNPPWEIDAQGTKRWRRECL